MEGGEERRENIYKVCRMIKKKEKKSVMNYLVSIKEDSIFVAEISEIWCDLPVVANLRCGLWYSPSFHSTSYFKSTDGHSNNYSFSTSRLNLHIALLSGQKGGCLIVDSTRKGKLFPDSMSKTIPIWACVLNRAIFNHRNKFREADDTLNQEGQKLNKNKEWDCSLHLPLWVSKTERAVIEGRLDEWTRVLESSGADILSLSSALRKPLRPLWISQRTVIWLNEVPDYTSWDFTPLLLISASSRDGIPRRHSTSSDFTWSYIPGAGDDEESWAKGLSPRLFWKHVSALTTSGPVLCDRLVAEIVERERASSYHRGCGVMQRRSAVNRLPSEIIPNDNELLSLYEFPNLLKGDTRIHIEDDRICWLGPTNIALCSSQSAEKWDDVVDCVLNCDVRPIMLHCEAHLHLPIKTPKYDRFSLQNNLGRAVEFARINLGKGRSILVCCCNGEDVGFCVCLAIFTRLFTQQGDPLNLTRVTFPLPLVQLRPGTCEGVRLVAQQCKRPDRACTLSLVGERGPAQLIHQVQPAILLGRVRPGPF